jgi:hypothetical protein
MTAGGQDDGDGSGVNDWMRSGLNADATGAAPVDEAPRGGSFGKRRVFLGAGVLAAGLLGVTVVVSSTLEGTGPGGGGSSSSIAVTTTAPSTTTSPPSTSPVAEGLENLETLDDLATADPTLAALVAACGTGSRTACDDLLILLAQQCENGDLPSCDGLYRVAPAGSDHQTFGATCGGRSGPEQAGRCAEQ